MRWNRWTLAVGLLALGACAPSGPAPDAPAPGDLPRREPEVRVGLLVDTTSVQLSAPGGFELVRARTGDVVFRFPAEERVFVTADAAAQLSVGSQRMNMQALDPGTTLLARPAEGGIINIGGKPYRGTALVRAAGPGRVTAINQVDLETYLLGVVPREIGKVGPELLEAAKAQAVAARTYAVKYLGRREELGFDVFATVQDQVYGGVEAEHSPVSQAVRETAGEILTYQGEPIEAFYHSTCAGRTAAIEEVWDEEPRPYLVSVVDINPETGEAYDVTSNRFRWTERWTGEQLEEILSRTLADSLPAGRSSIGELRDLEILRLTPSGRVKDLRITTTAGTFTVGGDRVRWIFRTPKGAVLNSSKFDLEVERDRQGEIVEVVATGGGWGHGIGMCQVGAMGRARAGQDYRTILDAYYPETRILDLY